MPFTIRRANAGDQRAIQALVRSSNINPIGIHWQRFLIAEDAGPEGRRILGIGQVKVHGDGSRELASIATVRDRQGEGIATALIESLLAAEARTSSGPLYLTCRSQMEPFYQRFGFRRVETPAGLPAYFRRLMRLAKVFWAIGSLLGRGEGGLIMVRRGA
ncbi:MAG: GNAT family N-acetyltransferase [Nitrososphaerales archaeon]